MRGAGADGGRKPSGGETGLGRDPSDGEGAGQAGGRRDGEAGKPDGAPGTAGADAAFVSGVLIPSLNATAALATSNLSGVTLALVAHEKALKEKKDELAELIALRARLTAETAAMEEALRSKSSLVDRMSKDGGISLVFNWEMDDGKIF